MLKKKERITPSNGGNDTTLISRHAELNGDMHFRGNLVVEGKVSGNVCAQSDSDARLQLVDSGVIEGEIRVPYVVINGNVKGDVHAGKHLELASKAVVEGNVHYQLIEMVKGAQVNGSLVSNVEAQAVDESQMSGFDEENTIGSYPQAD